MTDRKTTDRRVLAYDGRYPGRMEFLSIFVLAAAGSFVLPSIGPAWLLAVWGATWMLLYLAAVRVRWSDYFETEDFADNFYYLGFLLTLAALAGALVRLGDINEDILRAVLGQFGLALVTTIVGLTGRTVLMMSRTTLEETEERTGRRVTRAFDDFTRSLNRLTAEADTFAADFGEGLRNSLSRIEGHVDDFATAATATNDRLGAVRDGLDSLGGAISGTASDVQTSGQQLTGGLREIGDRTRPRLVEIGEQLDHMLGRLREVSELLQRIGTGADTASRESVERLERLASGLASSLDSVARAAQSATAGVEDQAAGMAGVVRQWREQAEQLAAVHRQLVAEAEGSSEAVVQVRREIATGVDALIAALRPAVPTPHGD